MGLNKIVAEYLKFNETLVGLYPKKKNQINLLFQSIRELTDEVVYEDTKVNNNRYPYYKKNFKAKSILVTVRKITEICSSKEVNKEKLFKELVDLNVKLQWMQWHLADSRRSINSLLNTIEKELK